MLKICTHILYTDHAMNALSNPVLQTTLLVLQSVLPDLCQDICKQIKDDLNIFASVDNNAGLIKYSYCKLYRKQLLYEF